MCWLLSTVRHYDCNCILVTGGNEALNWGNLNTIVCYWYNFPTWLLRKLFNGKFIRTIEHVDSGTENYPFPKNDPPVFPLAGVALHSPASPHSVPRLSLSLNLCAISWFQIFLQSPYSWGKYTDFEERSEMKLIENNCISFNIRLV